MAIFSWIPDYDASEDSEATISEAKYGDGYVQRTAIGINNIQITWDLAFTLRPLTEVNAMNDFFNEHKGATSFLWTPPGGTEQAFICKKWKRIIRTNGDCSLSATFERAYE